MHRLSFCQLIRVSMLAALNCKCFQLLESIQRRPILRHFFFTSSGTVFAPPLLNFLLATGEESNRQAWAVPSAVSLSIKDGVIHSRLGDDSLVQMPPKKGHPSYPSFLEGTWNVTQTLVACSAPLGTMFMGGPNGDGNIGQASLDEANSKRNIPVSLQFRYIREDSSTTGNDKNAVVVEDRLFNTRQRLDAFAGRSVVASTVYTRDPITNQDTAVSVLYRGPAAQKIFVTGFDQEEDMDGTFWCSERQRSLFALTNANMAPPISTDSELLWQFQPPDETDIVHAKLRIAGFLNPNDRLYFEAKRRAVTLQDYVLELRRCRSENA